MSGTEGQAVAEFQQLRLVNEEEFAEVKEALSEEQLLECDDDMIRRFIRASDGKPTVAVKRITATLEWRAQEQPQATFCEACRSTPGSHYMHVVGFCRRQRPVMYSCLRLAKDRSVEANRRHMIQTFERSVRMMPHGVSQWIWVSDFEGFGMSDLNPSIAKSFLQLAERHYPERLGAFVFVDAPRMFSVLWKAISPLVDPVTKAKLKFIPYDVDDKKTKGSVLRGELLQLFDEELTDWLMEEMKENRCRKAAAKKVYSYEDLAKLAPEAIAGGSAGRGCAAGSLCLPEDDMQGGVAGAGRGGTTAAATAATTTTASSTATTDTGDEAASSSASASLPVPGMGDRALDDDTVADVIAAEGGVHDFRGTRRLLQRLADDPALLSPQVPALTAAAT